MSNNPLSRRRFLGGVGASAVTGALSSRAMAGQQSVKKDQPLDARDSAKNRPNIVIFMPDELRADALGCYGNPLVKTPNFDRLAKAGTRFANCHVQYPICGPSRCSMLTGWPVSVRGHRSQSYFLRNNEPNLFRYLRQGGYDVFWFGKNDALAAESFSSSVTQWNFIGSRDFAEGKAGLPSLGTRKDYRKDPATFLGEEIADPRQTRDFACVEAAIRILQRQESEHPFCIFLPLSFPHPPYGAPTVFHDRYDPGEIKDLAPAGVARKPDYLSAARAAYGLDRQPSEIFRTIRARYYGAVTYSDWMLGQLLDAIEASGHRNDTAVIVCSDHGDYAGDYGMVEKWPSGLEDQLTHIPLIISDPGSDAGRETSDPVMLFDMMATCLDLAGVEANHTHFARSLVPYLRGENPDARVAAFAEGGYNTYEPQCFEYPPPARQVYYARLHLQITQPQTVSRVAMIRTRDHKLVFRPAGQSELYRYQDDPRELNNRYGDSELAAIQAGLKEQLLEWYLATTGVAPMDKDQREFPPYQPDPHLESVRAEWPFLKRK